MGAPPCQVKMLRAGCFRRIKLFFNQHTHPGLRSLKTTTNHTEDVLLQMDNPYKQPEKGCTLCNIQVDYRNIQLLSQFISPHTGRIYGRRITGLCGIKQKEVSKAIKKAHSMGFMSVTHKHPQFMKDPNICGLKHVDK